MVPISRSINQSFICLEKGNISELGQPWISPNLSRQVFSFQGEEKKSIWIQFKFERLGDFCYRCGCLDHGESSCSKNDVNIEGVIDSRKAYGPWLRVSSAPLVVTEKDARSGLTNTVEIQEHVSTTHA